MNFNSTQKDPIEKLQFKCDQCLKCFTLKANLQRHIKNHSGEKPFKCEICGKGFFHHYTLIQHKKTTHEGIKPYKCDLCGRQFADRGNLHVHISEIHTTNEPIECGICTNVIKSVYYLKKHMRKIHNIYARKDVQ